MARTETTTLPTQPARPRRAKAPARFLLSALLAGAAVAGCKGFIEDQKEFWTDLTSRPDPWKEVKTTTSPDRKARFVAQLREPEQHGGTKAQQDEMFDVLANMAINDRYSICRLQAIHKLAEFKDPRRVGVLRQAYDNAVTFSDEVNSQIRQQTLKGLGETTDPSAQAELIRVARAGAKENNHADQQLTLDERLTAVRALGNFRGPEVNDALLHILRTEKDVALRDRAVQSLESATGRRLGDDLPAWEQALNAPSQAPPQKSGPLQLIKGWQK